MIANRSIPATSVVPELAYADVAEAGDWLCKAFGFEIGLRIGDHRAQLVFGDGAVIVTELGERPGASSVLVRVVDADAHHERAARAGARILNPPTDYPYGERQYGAKDLGPPLDVLPIDCRCRSRFVGRHGLRPDVELVVGEADRPADLSHPPSRSVRGRKIQVPRARR